MRGLSLTQPYATLVALGKKCIETRSWKTSYRGQVAIHASKTFPNEYRDLCWDEPFRSVLATTGLIDYVMYEDLDADAAERFTLPLGAIIATATLSACVRTEEITAMSQGLRIHEIPFGNYTPGRYAFVLQNIVPLETPIVCRGALGLWAVPDGVWAASATKAALDTKEKP